jgi:hypothetical protein
VPGSRRRSILSRAGSLPRSSCRLCAFSPPPRLASAECLRSSYTSAEKASVFFSKASLFVSTKVPSLLIPPRSPGS